MTTAESSRTATPALAVGLGAAVITGQGIAHADLSDSGSSPTPDLPSNSAASDGAESTDVVAEDISGHGYQGVIYRHQPTTDQYSFADDVFLLPNNHGRVFGPAPSQTDTGYVWTASLSCESLGFYDLTPTHIFVSFNRARDGLRDSLVANGATDLGLVPMGNKLNSGSQTTGDHDGYAAVIRI